MNVFLRIDINIMAIIVLGATTIIANQLLDKKDMLNRVFLKVSLIIMLQLFFETATCVINRQDAKWLIPISTLLHICLFSISPILTYFWYLLIKHLIIKDQTVLQKTNKILLIPVILSIILTVLSPIFHYVFYISKDNVYHRGPLFVLTLGITYIYIICSSVLVIKNRKKIIKEEYIILFTVNILPVIGAVIQMLFYGPLLMFSCAAFSLVITYNFLEQRMVHLDSLTGAWNRRSFDYYIANRLKYNSDEKMGIIYFDLDKLKYINDSYGHREGDLAIKTSINIIKSVIQKKDIIVRMGGDEFIIVMDCETKEEIDKAVEIINDAFKQFNEKSDMSYKLECSFGADIFNSEYSSIEQFLNHIDNMMYRNKRLKYE